jgi:hypothetical protein
MIKAAKALQLLYPKVIHLTCLAHALRRVAGSMLQTTIAQITVRLRRSSISLTQKIHLQSNLYRSCLQSQCQETLKANFCGISKSITRLEIVGIHLCDEINTAKQTESVLSRPQGEVANKFNAKLQKCT